ncbi:MAG: Sapep family Mn(2+)-dependent dipeptidase, partial [Mycoplasmatales bacterium]
MNKLIKNKAIELQDETIAKIQEVVRIDSVRNVEAKQPGMPFGPGIANALDAFLKMAEEIGLRTFSNPDGLYGYAEIGPEGTEMLGIIGHIDVVPVNDVSQWTDGLPFSADIKNGQIIGRGALDDKGPMVVCLMAIKTLLEVGYTFEKRVRFVVGCAEETTWECINEYNRLEEMPSMSFSPDANFPLINAEKTIHQFDVFATTEEKDYSIMSLGAYNAVADSAEYKGNDTTIIAAELDKLGFNYKLIDGGLNVIGKSAHGMACDKGINAVSRLAMAMYNVGINSPAIDFLATKVKETFHAELIQGKLIQEDVSGFLMFTIGKCEISGTSELI